MSVENSKKVVSDLVSVVAKVIVEVKSKKGLLAEGADLAADPEVQAAVKDFVASISAAVDELKIAGSADYFVLGAAVLESAPELVKALSA